jgi:tetratricopeptide (TPR) repeat protein
MLPDPDTLPASLFASLTPQQVTGSLVVITQESASFPTLPHVQLTSLDARASALLILRGAGLLAEYAELDEAGEEQSRAALELARELQGQPLALALAGGYIRATDGDLQTYLALFRDHITRTHPVASSGEDDQEVIAVACELLLTHLVQKQPELLAPLQLCALLQPEALPALLLRDGLLSKGSAEPGEEYRQVQEAIPTLLTYGLLTADEQFVTLSMHPLLQDVVRQFFSLDTSQQHIMLAFRQFQRLIPLLATETPASRLRLARQIHHLAQLSEHRLLALVGTAESGKIIEVFDWAASLFWQFQLIKQAEFLLSKVLILQERGGSASDQAIATTLGNLALLNGLLKQYPEAEHLSQRAVESKVKALGMNHPDVLLALDYLGRIYAEQGKQQQARLCYEQAIAIGDQVQLRRHPASCLVRYHLALLLIDQERLNEAASLLRRVCFVLERLSGEYETLLMEASFSLAEISSRLQNPEEAATCYRKALPLCEHLLGEEHLTTLDHLEQAALIFLQQGHVAEAESLLRRVLAVREQTPGSEPAALASCLNNLARVVLERHQLFEAATLLERAYQIIAAPPASSVLASILDTLAALEAAQQHYEQAIDFSRRALEVRHRLKQNLTHLVENLNTIATFYLALGKASEAEMILSQALTLYQQAHRPEDLALHPVLTNLAAIEIEQQQAAKARMYLERARAISVLAWGGGDPRTKEIVQKLADLAQFVPAFAPDTQIYP